MLHPRTPVLVGSGQFLQRSDGVGPSFSEALDPAAMMCRAIEMAATDAGLSTVPVVDALRVVGLLSWRYGNAAWVVAEQLGLQPRELAVTTMGGNSPQTLVNVSARQIQTGELDIAILTGGEASRTRMRARKQSVDLAWPTAPAGSTPQVLGEDFPLNHPSEIARKIVMPVQVYPMFETAIRAAAGRSVDDHQVAISELWAGFSAIAAANPNAWSRVAKTAEEIRTVTADNRMIGHPYPKYMNSNNDVDMSAALIICSVEKARALGISEDRWVFVHSGVDCHEHQFMSHRWSFHETPAIRLGGQRVLELAGLGIDDIDLIDLYSCFPAAVQLGAQSLGITLPTEGGDRAVTRTGGLPFAGGPWNNYVMHAIATLATELRETPGTNGLVWGNGGYTTKHAFGVYSTRPPGQGFRHASPQDEIDAMPRRILAEPIDAIGPATIEAYTVMHSRDGAPENAIASCLLADGRRAWGTSADASLAAAMCDGEWVGRTISLDRDGTLHEHDSLTA